MSSRELGRTFDEVGKVPAKAMAPTAALVREIAEDEARRATGDGRMSGMGRRGPRLRAVVAKSSRSSSGARVEVRGVPAGAWAILESGARPHVIRPRRRGVLFGRSMRHPISGPVRHPGARGQRTWSRVVEQSAREVPDLVDDLVAKAVR